MALKKHLFNIKIENKIDTIKDNAWYQEVIDAFDKVKVSYIEIFVEVCLKKL